ncbi:MAG TPA: 3-phosphoshikimate 1-carboxyvinyltransferase [Candidatus Aminicenantes bacterium]|nr:3-phosphoshikimate 1-carboxyvinyltransferase [Candidatus Aminicenantes bacterium]
MNVKRVEPFEIAGTLAAPPSKSMTLRAVAAALLAPGASSIEGPSLCEDALAGFRIAEALGARLESAGDRMTVRGGAPMPEAVLDCRESGLSMRMFAPIAALSGNRTVLAASGSLRARPMGMLEGPLRRLGAACRTRDGRPPVEVRGPLASGRVAVDGTTSSQFLSGLLCALPLCPGDSDIRAAGLKSKPYAAMTVDVLSRFGVRVEASGDMEAFFVRGGQGYTAASYAVEGDWSGGAFLLVAGALAGSIVVDNLQTASLQPDKRVLEALDAAGARVRVGDGSVTVENESLRPFVFDATHCPDLFPPLAALAAACPGRSVIRGAGRLIHKESDRASALAAALGNIGVTTALAEDRMEIEGGRIRGGTVDPRGDHRIAMAGAVAGLASREGVAVSDWTCVSKSYPGFFRDLESLGRGRA